MSWETALRRYVDSNGGEPTLEDANAGGPGGGPPTQLPTAAVLTAICRTLDTGERQRAYVPTTIAPDEIQTLTKSLTLPPAAAGQSASPTPAAPVMAAPVKAAQIKAAPYKAAPPQVAPVPLAPAVPTPPRTPNLPRNKPANDAPWNAPAPVAPSVDAFGAAVRPRAAVPDPRSIPIRRQIEAQVPRNPIRPNHRKPRPRRRGLLLLLAICLFAGGAVAAYYFNFADVVFQWLQNAGTSASSTPHASTRPATAPATNPATQPSPGDAKKNGVASSPPPAPDTRQSAGLDEPKSDLPTPSPTPAPVPPPTPDPVPVPPALTDAQKLDRLTNQVVGTWEGVIKASQMKVAFTFEKSGKADVTFRDTFNHESESAHGTWKPLRLRGEESFAGDFRFTFSSRQFARQA